MNIDLKKSHRERKKEVHIVHIQYKHQNEQTTKRMFERIFFWKKTTVKIGQI